MALLLIANPPTTFGSNADWVTLLTRSNANMLGHGLSIPIFTLTNWDGTTTIPAIAEGSIIEVGGSFYQADADTALTDDAGLIDGTVHIKLVPAGGGASVVPTLTNDVIPAWDANKAGWYDVLDKFLPYEMEKATAVFTLKSEYIDQNNAIKISPEGKMYIDTIAEKTASAGISFSNTVKWKNYYKAVGATQNVIFDVLALWVPTVNDYVACHGQWQGTTGTPDQGGTILGIQRVTNTNIRIVYVNSTTFAIEVEGVNDGSGIVIPTIEIMSNFDPISLP